MKNHDVFVVDKLNVARALAAHIGSDARAYAISINSLGLFDFRYPRGLRMADYPFIGEPAWKLRSEACQIVAFSGGDAIPSNARIEEILRSAARICYAAGYGTAGPMQFDLMLSHFLGGEATESAWPVLPLTSLHSGGLTRAFASMGSTLDDGFRARREEARAKRYFDYNFNVNALTLFGNAQREAGAAGRQQTVSKYGLQLLYHLKERPGHTASSLLQDMEHWSGTGRYDPCGLGSLLSRPAILNGLQRAGFMSSTGVLSLTPVGATFLSLLHPDCRDPDLPMRIRRWVAEWPASKPKMERYLRTFFGKQTRYRAGNA